MLPFIAGLAAGAAAVYAYNNSDALKKTIDKGAKKVKEAAETGYDKGKEIAGDVKETVGEKIDQLKHKKETETVSDTSNTEGTSTDEK